MIINDGPTDSNMDKVADELHKYDKPFILIFDNGDNKAHVLGNMDKFKFGYLYMANLLEAVAETMRELDEKEINNN